MSLSFGMSSEPVAVRQLLARCCQDFLLDVFDQVCEQNSWYVLGEVVGRFGGGVWKGLRRFLMVCWICFGGSCGEVFGRTKSNKKRIKHMF